jgi:hypothetical protein
MSQAAISKYGNFLLGGIQYRTSFVDVKLHVSVVFFNRDAIAVVIIFDVFYARFNFV